MRDTARGERGGGDERHTQTHIAIQIFLDLRKDRGGGGGDRPAAKEGGRNMCAPSWSINLLGRRGKNCLPTPISHNAARRQKEEGAFFLFLEQENLRFERYLKKKEAATFYFRVLLLILCGKEKMTAAKKGGTSSISQGPPSNKRGTDRRVRARV